MEAGKQILNELDRPLGLDGASLPGRSRLGRMVRPVAVGLAGMFLAAIWIVVAGKPSGGAPQAVAKIEIAPSPKTLDDTPTGSIDAAPKSGQMPATASAQQVEEASGVKIVRGNNGAAPGGLVLHVPEIIGIQLTPAPDKRLVEKGRYGPLPRIGADGARPADIYARPVMTAEKLKSGAPRIAILVGGLGLSPAGTSQAIDNLPGAISLGFAPYGSELSVASAAAREAGHETILQAPMEAFDAANAPGPHQLMAGASAEENLDSLRWLMSRFSGYIGVANYQGAKLTAEPTALAPILSEISSRGLLYIDDGSSPRSVAREVAANAGSHIIAADLVIDAAPSPDKIDAALAALEAMARRRGDAIGVASALPMSIERIARWATSLEARGIALVPISALSNRTPAQVQK